MGNIQIGDMLIAVLILGAIGFSVIGSRMMSNVLSGVVVKVHNLIKDVNVLYHVVDTLIVEKKKHKTYKEIRRKHRWNRLRR